MKGLLKYLSPFAPDQSGAAAVLYDFGGLLIICDAGGCTGNICGFDEPRWFGQKSAIFSAGLRDMDAILGRDDKLVEKLGLAAKQVGGRFIALIGTPVPAVIATDYRALKRMAAKKTGFPVIGIECKGTALYDKGARDAWMELFETFTEEPADRTKESGVLGIIGMTPLDISMTDPSDFLKRLEEDGGYDEIRPYGMGAGLNLVKRAACVSENLVVSPAGLKSARWMERKYGIPYKTGYPFFTADETECFRNMSGKKILIVHQQMAANEIRDILRSGAGAEAEIVCGTWFLQDKEYKEPQDVRFETEEKFREYVLTGDFDVIIGDGLLRRAVREFGGTWILANHYAISGYDVTQMG